MTIHNNLSELIGNTPLVKLHHVTDGIKATIAVKVEYFNPGGSSKDRIAERIIDAAEQSGQLKPGGVIRRAHLGQHRRRPGPGRPAARLPHRFHPAGQGFRIQARGAARLRCRSHRHTDRRGPDDPRSYYQVAERLANTIPGGFRPNQYDNPNGPLSHYYTTGPEIWEATDHKVTHFVPALAPAHHLRHRQVPQGSLQRRGQGHRLRPGRLHLLRFLTRRSPPVRYRGRRGGLLPQGFRPEHHRRHRARIRRRSL